MNLFEILIKEPIVLKWFTFLYMRGELDETIERIAKYYIDFCLTVNEKELEHYFDTVPSMDIFQTRSKENIPFPLIFSSSPDNNNDQ